MDVNHATPLLEGASIDYTDLTMLRERKKREYTMLKGRKKKEYKKSGLQVCGDLLCVYKTWATYGSTVTFWDCTIDVYKWDLACGPNCTVHS